MIILCLFLYTCMGNMYYMAMAQLSHMTRQARKLFPCICHIANVNSAESCQTLRRRFRLAMSLGGEVWRFATLRSELIFFFTYLNIVVCVWYIVFPFFVSGCWWRREFWKFRNYQIANKMLHIFGISILFSECFGKNLCRKMDSWEESLYTLHAARLWSYAYHWWTVTKKCCVNILFVFGLELSIVVILLLNSSISSPEWKELKVTVLKVP